MDGGADAGARPLRITFLLAACLPLMLACNLAIFSHSSPTTTPSPTRPVEQSPQAAAPTQTMRPAASATPWVSSASNQIVYSDWLLGSENACCSGVVEWDDFHEHIQGYNKTYADIDACSLPLFINLDQRSIEGKFSGEGAFSELDSARSQAKFSAVVVESWVKPLPTLDGWHFGGVLEVYILMNAARKGWIGDSPTWLEGTRSIILRTNFIGQTDQNGAPGGVYTWSTRAGSPVSFQVTCRACPLPQDFPPPQQPR
jgi:hypothetical protein